MRTITLRKGPGGATNIHTTGEQHVPVMAGVEFDDSGVLTLALRVPGRTLTFKILPGAAGRLADLLCGEYELHRLTEMTRETYGDKVTAAAVN